MDGTKHLAGASNRYDEDFLAWAKAQAVALRAQDWSAVDWENVAEEIDCLGDWVYREIDNRVATLFGAMLKLDYAHHRGAELEWREIAGRQRLRLEWLLEDFPAARANIEKSLAENYAHGRDLALIYFNVFSPKALADYERRLPTECPYTVGSVLGE